MAASYRLDGVGVGGEEGERERLHEMSSSTSQRRRNRKVESPHVTDPRSYMSPRHEHQDHLDPGTAARARTGTSPRTRLALLYLRFHGQRAHVDTQVHARILKAFCFVFLIFPRGEGEPRVPPPRSDLSGVRVLLRDRSLDAALLGRSGLLSTRVSSTERVFGDFYARFGVRV